MGRPPKQREPAAADANRDTIILSVKLSSGRFETSMRFNFPAEPEEFEQQLKAWHEMVQTGFKIGASEMRATFDNGKDQPT